MDTRSYLKAFSTPWGRFIFPVLSFGLNCAPREFWKIMDDIFKDEVININFGDIALGSATVEEHCNLW